MYHTEWEKAERAKVVKLPKWAQALIARLEARIKELTRKEQVLFGYEDTNTHWIDYSHHEDERPLPHGALVRFKTKDGYYIDVRVTSEDELQIMGNAAFDIVPMVTNHILLKKRD